MIVEWHLTKQSLGLTMAAALVGMTGGSFVGDCSEIILGAGPRSWVAWHCLAHPHWLLRLGIRSSTC
jgi:hypothetical protein